MPPSPHPRRVPEAAPSGLPVSQETSGFGPGIHRIADRVRYFPLAVAAAATAYGLARHDYTGLDLKEAPVAAVGDAIKTVSEYVGPGLMLASGIGVAAFVSSSSRRELLPLSNRGLSAAQQTAAKPGRRRTKMLAGAMIPAAGITCLTTAFMIQQEVESGPNRVAETIINGAEARAATQLPSGGTITINWQTGTKHFMQNSTVPSETVFTANNAVQGHTLPPDIQVNAIIPFKADLTEIPTTDNPHQAALVLSVAQENGQPSSIEPEVRPGAICKLDGDSCILRGDEAIADAGEGLAVGDVIPVRGHDVRIVGLAKTPQSLMNRLVLYKGMSEEELETGYSGFVTVARSQADAEAMLDYLNLHDVAPESAEEFLAQNRDFWTRNGTPLIMLMVGDTLMLAAFSFAGLSRFEAERDKPHLATLRALGASRGQIAGLQHARIALKTARAVVPAAAVSQLLEFGVNSIMTGFHGEVSPANVAAATGVVLGTQVLFGMRGPGKELSGTMNTR